MNKKPSWDLSQIPPVIGIKEEIGYPQLFIGRQGELQRYTRWLSNIPRELSKSQAIIARRKTGKTAFLQRLYNIAYSHREMGVIPFYYEVKEGKKWVVDLSEDFFTQFMAQYLRNRYYWSEQLPVMSGKLTLKTLREIAKDRGDEVVSLMIREFMMLLQRDPAPVYIVWSWAQDAPRTLAEAKNEYILQIIDEFQLLNSEMYLDKACTNPIDNLAGSYLGVAESKIAPLIVTGSYVGWIIKLLMEQLPSRFVRYHFPALEYEEGLEAVYRYSTVMGAPVTDQSAILINEISGSHPYYISTIVRSEYPEKDLSTPDGVMKVYEYEIFNPDGELRGTWIEYIARAFNQINNVWAKKIVMLLSRHKGELTRKQIKEKLDIPLDDQELERKLKALVAADILNQGETNYDYSGIGDRVFELVFRSIYQKEAEDLQLEAIKKESRKELAEKVEQITKNRNKLRGLLADLRGKSAEYMILRYLKFEAYKSPEAIKDKVNNYREGILFVPYDEVKPYIFNLEGSRIMEIDIYAVAGEGVCLAFEVKNRSDRPVSRDEVDTFLHKLSFLRQKEGRRIEGIYYSRCGFVGEALALLKKHNLMYTDYHKWWE